MSRAIDVEGLRAGRGAKGLYGLRFCREGRQGSSRAMQRVKGSVEGQKGRVSAAPREVRGRTIQDSLAGNLKVGFSHELVQMGFYL